MEEILRAQLATCCAAYIAVAGGSREKIGDLALNDNTFFRRVIDEQRGFTVRTYDRVIGWLAANWPPEATWPPEVPRPAISVEAA